jgi:hypothetical protein
MTVLRARAKCRCVATELDTTNLEIVVFANGERDGFAGAGQLP